MGGQQQTFLKVYVDLAISEAEIAAILAKLVAHSLVIITELDPSRLGHIPGPYRSSTADQREPRFRMLNPIREYVEQEWKTICLKRAAMGVKNEYEEAQIRYQNWLMQAIDIDKPTLIGSTGPVESQIAVDADERLSHLISRLENDADKITPVTKLRAMIGLRWLAAGWACYNIGQRSGRRLNLNGA